MTPWPPARWALAVEAGVRYAELNTETRDAPIVGSGGRVEVGPGVAVAVVLAFLNKHKHVGDDILRAPYEQRLARTVTELRKRVVGVFLGAPAALSALVTDARVNTVREVGAVALANRPWPAVVDFVVREAVKDDVFAEHIILQLDQSGIDGLGCIVLLDEYWLMLRNH